MVIEETAELVRVLVPTEDAEASFQILRLSGVSDLSLVFRTVPRPSRTKSLQLVTLWWSGRNEATTIGLLTPEEVSHDPIVSQNDIYLGHKTYGKSTCTSEQAVLNSLAATPSEAQPISFVTPCPRNLLLLPPLGANFHSSSNGCLSAPWRQRFLKR